MRAFLGWHVSGITLPDFRKSSVNLCDDPYKSSEQFVCRIELNSAKHKSNLIQKTDEAWNPWITASRTDNLVNTFHLRYVSENLSQPVCYQVSGYQSNSPTETRCSSSLWPIQRLEKIQNWASYHIIWLNYFTFIWPAYLAMVTDKHNIL